MLQGESAAQRGVDRQAMKVVVVVVREARLAGSKSERVWKGDKWVKEKREYAHCTKMCSQHLNPTVCL